LRLRKAFQRWVRQPTELAVWAAFAYLLTRVSPDWASRIAGWVGRWPLARSLGKAKAERNLARILVDLSPAARGRMARAVTGGMASTMIEYLHTAAFLREPERIRISGAEHVRAAVEAGRPVVLAAAHLALPEACRVAAVRLGLRPGLYYRPPNNPLLRERARRMLGVIDAPLFARNEDSPRRLRLHMGAGGSILILVDQRLAKSVDLPFLGRPAPTSTGPATLARRSGASLIPVRCRRLPGRPLSFEVCFDAPVEAADSASMMAKVNDRISEWIRDAPEQWLWAHDRWG